jgi:hypothetical protein
MQPVLFGNQQQSAPSQFGATAAPFPDLNFYSAGAAAGGAPVGASSAFSSAGSGSGDFGYGPVGGDLSGSMGGMGSSSGSGGGSVFDDEPPLLEELGINFKDIWSKTLAVSIPFRPMPTVAEDDADLAGPLVFCLLLGTCLLLTGKVRFSNCSRAFVFFFASSSAVRFTGVQAHYPLCAVNLSPLLLFVFLRLLFLPGSFWLHLRLWRGGLLAHVRDPEPDGR